MKRLKGYMFQNNAPVSNGLLLTPCNSIHMFFMKFPLDIVFLNEQNEIIDFYPQLPPGKRTKVVRGAVAALELPSGTIEEFSIEIGDRLDYIASVH